VYELYRHVLHTKYYKILYISYSNSLKNLHIFRSEKKFAMSRSPVIFEKSSFQVTNLLKEEKKQQATKSSE